MTDFALHARTISGDLGTMTRELVREIHVQAHEALKAAAISHTPTASGRMRSLWADVPSSPQSAIDKLQPTKVRNTAPHAGIINRGRRRSTNAWTAHSRRGKAYTVKAGKMLGSPRAPSGVKGPALRAVEGQEEAIFARAAAKVEGRGRR